MCSDRQASVHRQRAVHPGVFPRQIEVEGEQSDGDEGVYPEREATRAADRRTG